MEIIIYKADGILDADSASRAYDRLISMSGVESVYVDRADRSIKVTLEGATPGEVRAAIEKLGYIIESESH